MNLLRRGTQLLGIALLLTVGCLLILGATGAIGDTWRTWGANRFRDVAAPDLPEWAIATVGAAVTLVGLLLVIAQLLPPRQGSHRMYEIDASAEGDTRIRGRAVIRTVRHTVEQIEHVAGASVQWKGRSVQVEVHVDDEANLTKVEEETRAALGYPFWIDMGLADVGVNILVRHDGRPAQTVRVT
jgi:hypothetical protein